MSRIQFQATKEYETMAVSINNTPVTNDNSGQKKPPAKFWLNVGIMQMGDDGEEVFVGLKNGIPLDQIADEKGSAKNPAWNQIAGTKNDLRDQLINLAKSLDVGDAETVEGLVLQIRHAADPVVATTDEEHRSAVAQIGFARSA